VVKLVEAFRLASSIKKAGPRKFTQHMIPHVVRPAQIMWNKALGAVFLLLGVLFFGYAVNYYRSFRVVPDNSATQVIGICLSMFMGLVMTFLGASSLRKARRLSRL
jgi:hypothetical protein